jgi:alkylation response protein AidB-like acyl-CoA dehydrogenase
MIDVARRLADTVLFPDAQHVDRTHVPTSHLDALAAAGLFDLDGLEPSEIRRVFAAIGGGCGATFFVWVQHHGVVRTLAASPNEVLRNDLLDDFRTGRRIAGVAFAHVRRSGPPAISATRIDDGWRLDGHAPWATSWGIADRFCVAAESLEGEMVWTMLPGTSGNGLRAETLELPVFAATGTVEFHFDGCAVDDTRVVSVADAHAWRAADRRRAALGQPAVLGVAERAIRLLDERGPDAAATARRLTEQLDATWRHDDELGREVAAIPVDANGVDHDEWIVMASDHRAECLDLARRSTTALLAASGGGGMDLGHPAQRLAREATFYVIQAQTADGRAATLRRQ